MTILGVGMDIVETKRIAESIERFGDRFLRRVFLDGEVAYSQSMKFPHLHLAARFAAKEATIKVLRPTANQPDWRTMEVRRNPGGWCTMVLSGHAAVLADEAGIAELAVSLTHEETVAGAVVVALCHEPATPAHEPGAHLSTQSPKGEH